MQESLTNIINTLAAKLDPGLPSILAAHIWVVGAKTGHGKDDDHRAGAHFITQQRRQSGFRLYCAGAYPTNVRSYKTIRR